MNLLKSNSTYGTNSQNESAVVQKQLAKIRIPMEFMK